MKQSNLWKMTLAACLIAAGGLLSSCNTTTYTGGKGGTVGVPAGAVVEEEEDDDSDCRVTMNWDRNRAFHSRTNGYERFKPYRGHVSDGRPYDNQWGGRGYWDHKPYRYERPRYNFRGFYY